MNTLQCSTDLQSGIIRTLNAQTTLAAMLKQVVQKTAVALHASACAIFVVDPGGQTATQCAGTGYQESFVGKAKCRVVPAHSVAEHPTRQQKLGVTGWILSTGKPFLASSSDEMLKHPHRTGAHDPEQLPGEVLHLSTFLGVPLSGLHGEVIGMLKAERRAGHNANRVFLLRTSLRLLPSRAWPASALPITMPSLGASWRLRSQAGRGM